MMKFDKRDLAWLLFAAGCGSKLYEVQQKSPITKNISMVNRIEIPVSTFRILTWNVIQPNATTSF